MSAESDSNKKPGARTLDESAAPARLMDHTSDIDALKQALLKAERAQEKSEWLRSISEQLYESIDPEKIEIALNSLAEKLRCNRTSLRLKNPIGSRRDIVAESHAAGLPSMIQILSEKYPALLQGGTVPLAAGQDVVLLSVNPEMTALQQQLSSDLNVRHAAIIPLTQHGELQGELVLMSDVATRWDEQDLQLAKEFAQLVSLIFEREAIAQGLRESDERFHLAMEASQDGLWDAQLALDRVYVSPSYFRMMGYDLPGGIYPREATGIYIHPEDRQMVRDRLAGFVGSAAENDSIEFRMRHANGSDVWVLSRMYKAELNADGTPSRIIGVNTDITEFKRTQQHLRTAQAEADSANRAKGEFLARMSHEIRTPMNAILGLSHLVLESELDPEQRIYVKHIDDAAQLLLNLINDILDFSKIEAGKLELDRTDFNLDEVISRLVNLLVYKAEEKAIWLLIDLEPDVPVALHGDVMRLQQILVNLLNNAIKFTDSGGVYLGISLNAQRRFEFTVRDSGIGIDQRGQQLLFAPFSQADGSVTRRYGGSGLGLAISKYLAEMMGGSIRVESTVGVGSQFTVTLPFAISQLDGDERRLTDKRVAVIFGNPLLSQAVSNMIGRCAPGTGIERFTDLRDFADSAAPETQWLCLVDDEAMTDSEMAGAVSALRCCQPPVAASFAYLCNSGHWQKYSQSLADSVELVAKPLTPEKIRSLLFPEHRAASAEEVLPTQNRWQHNKVLLVEDNPVNQLVALGMMQKYELAVDVVVDGRLAIDRLQQLGQEYYQLVLMDMEMPVMDGYAATCAIRQQLRFDALPIVAMTAHAMKGDRERCLAVGANDYIAKPISSKQLHEMLSKYLQSDR